MNILDALRTGRQIKRKSQQFYRPGGIDFTYDDVMANDWEVSQIPEIVEFELDMTRNGICFFHSNLENKKWKIVATEVIE